MNKYIKRYKKLLIITIVCAIISTLFSVLAQFVKGKVLDYAIVKDFSLTLRSASILVAFILLEVLFHYFYDRYRASFAVKCFKDLKSDVFGSILRRDYVTFNKNNKGEYIAKYTNETEMIHNLYFSTLTMFVQVLIKVLFVSCGLFILEWRLAIITLILLTTPLYIPKLIEKSLQRSQKSYIDSMTNHMKHITDWLSGFELIKNFSIEKVIQQKYKKTNTDMAENMLRNKQFNYMSMLLSTLISYFSYFIVLAIAAYFVLTNTFSAGEFFVSIGMIDQLSYPLLTLSEFMQNLISIKPLCKSMEKFILEANTTKESKLIGKLKESIVYDNVSFSYNEDEKLITNFSTSITKDSCVLIRGESGCGKTTLINLLVRYYEPTGGTITVDGEDISKYKDIYNLATVVRQEAILFVESLRNNLTMYGDYSDEMLIDVLEKVNLKKYANNDGLDMIITDGGSNLSGGERKRICIARALLRSTPILILDEPLANLDEENLSSMEDLILNIKNKTVIIVSHQFSSSNIKRLDQIIDL